MAYFIADNIISSLGFTTGENFEALKQGSTGIRLVDDRQLYHEPVPLSVIDSQRLQDTFAALNIRGSFTRAEKMAICSIAGALTHGDIDPASSRTGYVYSTTKGNIDLLEKGRQAAFGPRRAELWNMGQMVNRAFNNPNEPLVISNACISGVLAINFAAGLINSGQFDQVIVTGVDIVSRFVVSGFMSFHSISPQPCRPFDKHRDGLSLGEAAGTIILGKEGPDQGGIVFLGGSSANDANHISGPSRTGEGSFTAIRRTFAEAGLGADKVDHISAHGTATLYNDEMESISIGRHGMESVPVNSFKGNWGHTLGAAGVIETAALIGEMKTNTLIGSAGFEQLGVSRPLNIIRKTQSEDLSVCLKMASGFGGSNAALLIKKSE